MKLSDDTCGSPAGAGGGEARPLRPLGRRRLLRSAALAAAALITAPRRGSAEPQQGVAADGLIAARKFAAGDVGFLLIDRGTGATLAAQAADSLFVPASVSKLATAYAAISILGADHALETLVLRRGDELWLVGGGDPVLDANDLMRLVDELAAQTPRLPAMRLYYDDSRIRRFDQIDAGQPTAATYNCGLGALNVNFNRVEVYWKRKRPADAPAFQVRSPAAGLNVPVDWVELLLGPVNQPQGAPFVFTGGPGVERWLYSPRLSLAGGLSLPVKSPGRHTALVFRQLCAEVGISLGQPQAMPAPAEAVPLARVTSRPLKEIVTGLLHHSNNMSAELIGLAASRKLTGQSLDLAASSATLVAWLQQRLPAVDWRGFVLANHSGLSTASRASPRQFVGLLSLIDVSPDFAQTLPSIDREDELLLASLGPPALAAVGKTGTMDYVRGLAGFLPGHDGHRLAFALFIFDAEKRRRFDAAFDPRILEPPPETRSWLRRARDLDHALLRRWVTTY